MGAGGGERGSRENPLKEPENLRFKRDSYYLFAYFYKIIEFLHFNCHYILFLKSIFESLIEYLKTFI